MRNLFEVGLGELENQSFELIHKVEMLCEICRKPISVRERLLRKITISNKTEHERLLNRAAVHDRAEVDLESGKIWFYDHDFPGDIHPECLETM